ncbi:nucleotidyltransferase family protein [Candidatus Poribacteria bacterium]
MLENTEDRLLLHCLGIGTDNVEIDELRQLSTDDWDEIIQQAYGHGVCPLLYHHLGSLGADADIPLGVEQKLRNIYFQNMKTNMWLFHELSKILSLLQEHSVQVIVLKGACLAELIYQDITLRPMIDIDLMIKSEDRLLVNRLMLQAGYRSVSLFSKRHLQWGDIVRGMIYKSGATIFDCHIQIDEVPDPWSNVTSATIASTDALILGAEELLLHLCVHADNHLRIESPKLIWWYDVAELLKHYQGKLDWDYIVQFSREHKMEVGIHRTLHLINKEFGGHVPAGVLDRLGADDATISIDHILHAAKVLGERPRPPSWFLDIYKVPSARDKICYVFARLFPSREYMTDHYLVSRPSLVYLYYPVRIFSFILTVPRGLFRLPVYLWNRYVSHKKLRQKN